MTRVVGEGRSSTFSDLAAMSVAYISSVSTAAPNATFANRAGGESLHAPPLGMVVILLVEKMSPSSEDI